MVLLCHNLALSLAPLIHTKCELPQWERLILQMSHQGGNSIACSFNNSRCDRWQTRFPLPDHRGHHPYLGFALILLRPKKLSRHFIYHLLPPLSTFCGFIVAQLIILIRRRPPRPSLSTFHRLGPFPSSQES